jgi:hypothetical protein
MHFKKQKNIPENACQLGTIRVCNVKSERRQNTEKATAYQEKTSPHKIYEYFFDLLRVYPSHQFRAIWYNKHYRI